VWPADKETATSYQYIRSVPPSSVVVFVLSEGGLEVIGVGGAGWFFRCDVIAHKDVGSGRW